MGRGDKVIEPEPEKAMVAAVPVPEQPLEPKKQIKRRVKKMADKKLDHESGGPETIRKDDAGEQGAIGSHGENVPAQEKSPGESDQNKEGE